MKKLLIISVLSSSLFAELSWDEYKQICKEDNDIITAVSANNQTQYNAIASAQATAQARLLERDVGVTMTSNAFLVKSYMKVNGVNKVSNKIFTKKIQSNAHGMVVSIDAKEPEFYPNGKVNSDGEPLGHAKAWVHRNCTSYRTYINFIMTLQ